jgi:hypothetical protein
MPHDVIDREMPMEMKRETRGKGNACRGYRHCLKIRERKSYVLSMQGGFYRTETAIRFASSGTCFITPRMHMIVASKLNTDNGLAIITVT